MDPDQSSVLGALPGSSSTSCATVGTHTDLRSGSVAMGNFVLAGKQYRTEARKSGIPEVGLYLIPQHAKHLKRATLTLDPRGSGKSKTITTRSVEDTDTSRYFAVQLPVAAPGTYQLSVVSGQDHGCYVVTFSK
jgi:hypothetical protein